MADKTEDISSTEDIGERLDALLDALEASSEEVARASASLGKPLDEVETAEAISRGAMLDDSGRAIEQPAGRVQNDIDDSAGPEPGADPEPEPEAVGEQQPETEPIAEDEPAAEVGGAEDLRGAEPHAETKPEAEAAEESVVDDGLLIEPEAAAPVEVSGNIDGAPAGPSDLEQQLDEELESLLASGMFEDPLAEMDANESAPPVEIPEEAAAEAVADAPAEPTARKPNLPTDEEELIGELDEQLAALADAQLAEGENVEPAVEPPAEAAAVNTAPRPAAQPEPKAEAPKPAKPEPAVVTRPVAPAGRGFKAVAARVVERSKPVVRQGLARAQAMAIAGATRANKPLKDKPHLKQIVGWVALVHVFYAVCLWAYVVLWHNPPPPAPKMAQPTLETAQGQ